ncbi:MAG: hypothetical protein N3A61_04015 [Ignavibacteria bacterium]|nr:hypothetical protein [Ignavibacteria bacterium]
MQITEQDIFNFVFFEDSVTEETRIFLKASNQYREEIDFYQSLKKSLEMNLTLDEKRQIAEKIPIYQISNLIELFPVVIKVENQNSRLHLAASSAAMLNRVIADTFKDEKLEYLIRAIQEGDKIKLFVFSTSEQKISNFQLKLYPSQKEFYLEDNSNPLELNSAEKIEKIELKLL